MLAAFSELSPSRPRYQWGPGSLPVSEVAAYYEFTDWPEILPAVVFLRRIRALDGAYLGWHAEQAPPGK